ncbi:MAG: AAA family ATPase [Woeseiaceae bacterium]|nr:AAA family ATPase [Woeseiaceae bacterium]
MRIESLLTEDAYPHRVDNLRLLDTHISWIVLTGPFAYKIKKPLKLEFLDYSSLEQRKHYCEEELRLNHRWAPELYVEVVPITGDAGKPRIGGEGKPIEYAVKMVQFPQSAQLDVQLEDGLLDEPDLMLVAEMIADKHASATVCDRLTVDDARRLVEHPMLANIEHLESYLPAGDMQALASWTRDNLETLWPAVLERQAGGFVRECHGDLKLTNLVRLSSGIVAYDCVEFSAGLRDIDVISDVSYLMMDLAAREREDLAFVFLNRYLERTGDYAGVRILGLYYVYHALIRAKIAAIRSTERDNDMDRESDLSVVAHYAAVARQWIERGRPCLIAMHGFSGCGKTWLSSRLLTVLLAIRLRSDVERKRRHGLGETEGSGAGIAAGIYDPAARADIYRELAGSAETVLKAGQHAIVDASFLGHQDRQVFMDMAERLGVPFVIVDKHAQPDELRLRLERRAGEEGNASEAGPDVLAYQLQQAEPLEAAELERTVHVQGDAGTDIPAVIAAIREKCDAQ